jgi:acetyltransferase-like isoleucine patch superfamily enzyme
VWIAPHVSIIQKISIGDGALVGIGSTVTRDVDPGVTVFGSPARSIQGKN